MTKIQRIYINREDVFKDGVTWTTVVGLYPHAYVPEEAYNEALARADAAESALIRAMPTTAAERDVLTERSRQVAAEGWDASHDDAHTAGELSVAAACYALLSAGWSRVALWNIWPKKWGVDWLKDCDQRRAKVKAAALLIADIERLDRALTPPADPIDRLTEAKP